jgi:hypothetical protein
MCHILYISCTRNFSPTLCPFVLDIGQQATDLAERIRQLAKDGQSALLFVMDDSLSILNIWFAEEMKLAATIIRRYFP